MYIPDNYVMDMINVSNLASFTISDLVKAKFNSLVLDMCNGVVEINSPDLILNEFDICAASTSMHVEIDNDANGSITSATTYVEVNSYFQGSFNINAGKAEVLGGVSVLMNWLQCLTSECRITVK